MRKALLYLALALGLAVPALAAANDNQLAGISVSQLKCFSSIDGDTETPNQPISFFFKLTNTGKTAKTVNSRFDLPVEAKPAASAKVMVSPVLLGGCDKAVIGKAKATPITCSSAIVKGASIRSWACPNVTVPAGHNRLFVFVARFGVSGHRSVKFSVARDSSHIAPVAINIE